MAMNSFKIDLKFVNFFIILRRDRKLVKCIKIQPMLYAKMPKGVRRQLLRNEQTYRNSGKLPSRTGRQGSWYYELKLWKP